MRREPATDLEIAELARRQFGVVTRAQLVRRGLTVAAIDHRVRAGRLRRLHRVADGPGDRRLEEVLDRGRPKPTRSGQVHPPDQGCCPTHHTVGSIVTRSELEEAFLRLCDDHRLPRPR
jgi:Transcriptional regulator, AbiEi antitoxin